MKLELIDNRPIESSNETLNGIQTLTDMIGLVKIDPSNSTYIEKYQNVFTAQEELIIKNKIFELIGRL